MTPAASLPPVPSVPLGAVTIPQLGFGVWQVPDDQVEAAVDTALACGYRHIDTARLYGNERGVGAAVRRALEAGDVVRDELFLTTKVWNDDHLRVAEAFEESMGRLGLEQLDLLLLHWPVPDAGTYVQAWAALLALRATGRVRQVGVCNFHPAHLRRLFEETGEYPAINQVELHPYLQQRDLRAFHDEHGIVTESWSPLASGKRVLDDPVIAAIATEVGLTPAQVIIRWHLQHGFVVLPKSVTPARIAANIAVVGVELTEQQMAAIDGLDRGFRTGPNPDQFHMDAVR